LSNTVINLEPQIRSSAEFHVWQGLSNQCPMRHFRRIFMPILIGIYSNPICTTGNCKFQHKYSILGYCDDWSDVTEELKFNVTETKEPTLLSYLPSDTSVVSDMPSTFASGIFNLSTMHTVGTTENATRLVDIIVVDPRQWLESQDSSRDCHHVNNTWSCKKYGAARCNLGPCVRTYSADISAGGFQKTFVSATPVDCWALSPSYEFLAVVNTEFLSDVEKTGLHDAGYYLEPNKRWLRYNLTFNLAVVNSFIFPSSMLTQNCLYDIHEMIVLPLLTMYLDLLFPGMISGFRA